MSGPDSSGKVLLDGTALDGTTVTGEIGEDRKSAAPTRLAASVNEFLIRVAQRAVLSRYRHAVERGGEVMRRVDGAALSETSEIDAWSRSELQKLLATAREHESRLATLLLLLF